jgi:hypothetical protein
MAHPLASDLGTGDLYSATLTNDSLVTNPLVLAAVALPVPLRAENALVEEALFLGSQSPVVDCLRLLDFTV